MADFWIELIPQTPLGPIGVAASSKGLVALEIGVTDVVHWGARYSHWGPAVPDGRVPFPAAAQLAAYFAGTLRQFDLPADPGIFTPFQRRVLPLVSAVPYGETRTYGGIAAEMGRPGAARAVGRANAANPLAIIIPCHRLVGADGGLRGYAGGLHLKRWLLDHERRCLNRVSPLQFPLD
jgi:O-6-methylguanine DNA methyltransferase